MDKKEAIKIAYDNCMAVCKDRYLLDKLQTCNYFLENKINVSTARKVAFECHNYARTLTDKEQI